MHPINHKLAKIYKICSCIQILDTTHNCQVTLSLIIHLFAQKHKMKIFKALSSFQSYFARNLGQITYLDSVLVAAVLSLRTDNLLTIFKETSFDAEIVLNVSTYLRQDCMILSLSTYWLL